MHHLGTANSVSSGVLCLAEARGKITSCNAGLDTLEFVGGPGRVGHEGGVSTHLKPYTSQVCYAQNTAFYEHKLLLTL